MSLPPNQRLAAPGKWPVVGEKAPRNDSEPWTVSISGAVETACSFTLDALRALPQVERVIDIHCVTRWSKPQVHFTGVTFDELLQACQPTPDAQFVSFVARSERNHSTSLVLSEARELGILIALSADGAPLPTEHGGPVRIVTPGRYFYKSLKWLERIEFLSEDRLGYWEADAGYHNHADPLAEERYIAATISPRVLENALAKRDFSGLDLRGVDLRGRDLSGLVARDAKLRDAHFEWATLVGADFSGANLSNAHFDHADVSNALFINSDVEGAAFDRAKIVGADFSGASLFGTTFDSTEP